MTRPLPDYHPVRLDGAWAIRDGSDLVSGYEGIATEGDAWDHIADLRRTDAESARDDAAALDDFEAIEFGEAA